MASSAGPSSTKSTLLTLGIFAFLAVVLVVPFGGRTPFGHLLKVLDGGSAKASTAVEAQEARAAEPPPPRAASRRVAAEPRRAAPEPRRPEPRRTPATASHGPLVHPAGRIAPPMERVSDQDDAELDDLIAERSR